MAYRDFKDLPRGAPFDKVLCDKIFTINKNPKYKEISKRYHFNGL